MIYIELTEKQRVALTNILDKVADGQHVVITTAEGIELAGVIPMGDLDVLHEVGDEIDGVIAEEALAEPGGTITLEEFEREFQGP